MNQLVDYISALTNLYGMVHKDLVLEIYNQQQDGQATVEQLDKYFVDQLTPIPMTQAYPFGEYFIHEVIVALDNFVKILKDKEGIPYYIPTKEELANYLDESYFEKTIEYERLYAYMKENIYPDNPDDLELACTHAVSHFRAGSDVDTVMHDYERIDLEFEDKMQYQVIRGLVADLGQNIRLWKYNGFKENELDKSG